MPAAAQDGRVGAWRTDQRGLGLIEIVLVLAIVAVAGYLLVQYLGTTARTVEKIQEERPAAHARLAADRATLGTIESALRLYHAQHDRYPADREALVALLPAPPRFQCAGNDFDYDPASGRLTLRITDPGRC